MKAKKIIKCLSFLILTLFPVSIHAYDFFDYHKWPITRVNQNKLKKETVNCYNKDKKLLETFVHLFDRNGHYAEMHYTCHYLDSQSKSTKFHYKDGRLSKKLTFDIKNNIILISEFKYIGIEKIIESTQNIGDDESIRYECIRHYDKKGFLYKEEEPVDEIRIEYGYDKYGNIIKLTYVGVDGRDESHFVHEYGDGGTLLKSDFGAAVWYYEKGKVIKIIEKDNPRDAKIYEREYIYYDKNANR